MGELADDPRVRQAVAADLREEGVDPESDPEGFETMVSDLADEIPGLVADVYRDILDTQTAVLGEEADRRSGFEERHARRWKDGLDMLESIVLVGAEQGSAVRERRAGSADPNLIDSVLLILHVRACRITREILCLLRGGFADGAHARWRTLHEVAVAALFISEVNDQELAQRFVDHEAMESFKSARLYEQYHQRLGFAPPSGEQLAAVEEQWASRREKYGPDFASDWAWAIGYLGVNKPAFKQLEKAVGLDHFRPLYRMAGHSVHAGPKGTIWSLSAPPSDPAGRVPHAGASSYGLADPGHGAAISLVQATAAFLERDISVQSIVGIRVLARMSDQCGELFLREGQAMDGGEDGPANGPR